MQKAVNASKVDKDAVISDVLHYPIHDSALFELFKRF